VEYKGNEWRVLTDGGAARIEQPHSSLQHPPLQLLQRDGRGEAGAAHRHPQRFGTSDEDSPTTVQLLPSRPSAHAPQCDGVQRLAWRAT
jgi:hypothetical protein